MDIGAWVQREEAYQQVSHSVSLFKRILEYMKTVKGLEN